MKGLLLAAASLALTGCWCPPQIPTDSQRDVVAQGHVLGLDSAALGEHRTLNVWLPPGYDASPARYPVIYLLDGSAHEDWPHLCGLVQFLTMYELMPRAIVVGIANVDRYRDFTHPSTLPEDLERLPTGGGSAKFLAFVEHELQPFVAQRYRTDGHRMLVGQSMGGLLATEVLLDHPQLFDRYVIVSPSLWWGGEALIDRAAQTLRQNGIGEAQVFVTLGSEHDKMHEVADRLVAALREAAPQVRVGYEPMPDETHATILHRGFYRAIEWFYGDEFPGL
ncbi:MAG: alpha/beta hydrolase-fold protein [Planctomycetota bacterium]